NDSVNNSGTIRKSAGSGESRIDVSFDSSGTVEAAAGTLRLNSPVAQVAGNTLRGGTWNVLAGATLLLNATITTNSASIILSGAGSSFPAIANLASNTGSFSVRDGRTFTTVGSLNNTGSVILGPAGTLNVSGTYSQSAAASLDIEIGGDPASG